MIRTLTLIISLTFLCCQCSGQQRPSTKPEKPGEINVEKLTLAAERLSVLIPKLDGKVVGLVVNNTSYVGSTHLADTLQSLGVNLKKIMAPEHGFRGTADAGEHVGDGMDPTLKIPVVSLYGKNRKPTPEQMADVDILIFDIQDVGTRFYTYISTLHYVMESCAEQNKKLIVLDRPNPNGYVDGPIRKPEFKSFLGLDPLPLVHGMTIGELAQMINGEGWLEEKKKCELEVVTMLHWKHDDFYSLPIKPSPNLPNDQSIRLYPSIGLFEGVNISLGRGTQTPFQILGHPDLKEMPFQFTPVSIDGMSKNPPFQDKVCYGVDLRKVNVERKIDLSYLISMYNAFPDKEKFFNNGFNLHAGNAELQEQIKKGLTEAQIKSSWQDELNMYKEMRKKYLLYP